MTTINNQDDFLEALRNNPAWREAVRALILGDELLQLPVRFDAFVQEFDAFAREQSVRTTNLEERVGRVESDTGTLKGDFARTRAVQDAPGIASDMGLEFVRALSAKDLSEIAVDALPKPESTEGRREDSGRVGEGATEEVAGLHLG